MDRPRLRSCDALLCAALLCAGAGVMPRGIAAVPVPGPAAGRPSFPVPAAPPDAPAARLDVVVTDPQGRAVADLRSADFELRESGVPRMVTSAEYRGGARGTRAFAFLLDDFHVGAGESTRRARAALSAFVDQLDPRDLAAALKPLEPAAAVRFTRDREPLRAAIAAFDGRQGDLTPRGDFETQFIGRAPQAVASARAQIVTAALRDLTLRTGELEVERPILVFVSDGFRRDPLSIRGARGADLQEVVRAAGRLHLTIYPFSPGSSGTAPAAEPTGPAMLDWLASQTGGRTVGASDAPLDGFARLSRDLASYYTLTWRPLDPDGRFHPIELRTTRRRVELRARAGYWAPLPVSPAPPVPSSFPTRALHRSAMIDTWVGFVPAPGRQPAMVVTWEPRAGVPGPAKVRLQARTPDGVNLFDGPLAAVRGSAGGSIPDSVRFAAAASRIELDLEVFDAAGRRLDLDSRDVEVPDPRRQRPGPVLWFPQVLRARAFREFESLAADLAAAPSSSRRFARGDRLLIRVPAVDASGDAVTVSARLLNAWGQPMREIPPAGTAGEGIAQFGLALSWLGPGQYLIELSGANAHGSATERIPFTLAG